MLAVEQKILQQVPVKYTEYESIDNGPWLILKHNHEQVTYHYDSVSEILGMEEFPGDGLGLSFKTKSELYLGKRISVGFPLPDSVHSYNAYVVSALRKTDGFEIGIWLPVKSKFDLQTILRSCDYLDVRQSS